MDYARQHDVTIEEIRACPMFAHFTDEEAKKVVETIKNFTNIVYNSYQNEKKKPLK